MIFNSYIFILLFLPIICLGYYFFIGKNMQQPARYFLLLASFVFYGYAGKKCLVLLVVNILVNYIFFRGIQYCNRREKDKLKKLLLGSGIILNLMILFYFKYYNFFVENINLALGTDLSIREIIQPIGISFIIFQEIAFLTDAGREEIDGCSFGDYLLFITYFPHVSSGPIILYREFVPQLKEQRNVKWDRIASGIYMFVMGLGKKVLIADILAQSVDWGYGNISALNSTTAVFVSIAYTIQIYFDFSGYSDMAIGISRILQIDLPMNFNSPYKARTILEFWDRWHMSLTRFLTKYLYIPLGGSRKGKIRTYINILIVFLCSGIWHGASWTFLVWGALHGFFMVMTRFFKKGFDKIPDLINRCITLLFVNFTWILFRAGTWEKFSEMVQAIMKQEWGALHAEVCKPFQPILVEVAGGFNIPTFVWAVAIVFILICIILKAKNVQEKADEMKYSVMSCVGISIVAILCVLSFSGVTSFIYAYF